MVSIDKTTISYYYPIDCNGCLNVIKQVFEHANLNFDQWHRFVRISIARGDHLVANYLLDECGVRKPEIYPDDFSAAARLYYNIIRGRAKITKRLTKFSIG